ncbi:MAG: hypothetical protein QOK29_92 [Rhodospirillaceae bacterium]|jgi:hypothetical protein|nr:hypothetical protein [Rhodospirillaceae bacterium]
MISTAAESRGFISLHFGVPLVVGPPVYYYPPPVYYYVPVPAYPAPPPVVASPPPQQICREYQTNTIIDGKPQRAYGTACLQPDGTWRIGP